jgi:hypothetical protein
MMNTERLWTDAQLEASARLYFERLVERGDVLATDVNARRLIQEAFKAGVVAGSA